MGSNEELEGKIEALAIRVKELEKEKEIYKYYTRVPVTNKFKAFMKKKETFKFFLLLIPELHDEYKWCYRLSKRVNELHGGKTEYIHNQISDMYLDGIVAVDCDADFIPPNDIKEFSVKFTRKGMAFCRIALSQDMVGLDRY